MKKDVVLKEIGLYVLIIFIFSLPFILYSVFSKHQLSVSPQPSVTPVTPQITQSGSSEEQIYTAPSNAYSIVYPTGWTKASYGEVTNFTYTEGGKTYKFIISPPGQINPEGVDQNTTTQTSKQNYGGKLFTRTVWSESGVPFYIEAIPDDVDTTPYFFSMELPPVNTSVYIVLFDQTMSSWVTH